MESAAGEALLVHITTNNSQKVREETKQEFVKLVHTACHKPEKIGKTLLRHRHQTDHEGLKGGIHHICWKPENGWLYTPSWTQELGEPEAQLVAAIKTLCELSTEKRMRTGVLMIESIKKRHKKGTVLEKESIYWAQETLGIKPGAGIVEIRKNFRQKIVKLHPDRTGGTHNTEKISDLLAAKKIAESMLPNKKISTQ